MNPEATTTEVINAFRDIAGERRIFSQEQLIAFINREPEDCLRLLDVLVEAGVLRRTESYSGLPFFWLAKVTMDSDEGNG